MSKSNQPKEIATALTNIANNNSNEELSFNPATGQLEVKRAGEVLDGDSVPATQFAREGFFSTTFT
jgi:hypothetical protein